MRKGVEKTESCWFSRPWIRLTLRSAPWLPSCDVVIGIYDWSLLCLSLLSLVSLSLTIKRAIQFSAFLQQPIFYIPIQFNLVKTILQLRQRNHSPLYVDAVTHHDFNVWALSFKRWIPLIMNQVISSSTSTSETLFGILIFQKRKLSKKETSNYSVTG